MGILLRIPGFFGTLCIGVVVVLCAMLPCVVDVSAQHIVDGVGVQGRGGGDGKV